MGWARSSLCARATVIYSHSPSFSLFLLSDLPPSFSSAYTFLISRSYLPIYLSGHGANLREDRFPRAASRIMTCLLTPPRPPSFRGLSTVFATPWVSRERRILFRFCSAYPAWWWPCQISCPASDGPVVAGIWMFLHNMRDACVFWI